MCGKIKNISEDSPRFIFCDDCLYEDKELKKQNLRKCKTCKQIHELKLMHKNTLQCEKCFHEIHNKYCQERRRENPKTTILVSAKSRAKKRNFPFNITQKDFSIPKYCPVLGIKINVLADDDSSPSLDKVDPKLGYIKGNINIISQRANRLKNDSTINDLIAIIKYMENHKVNHYDPDVEYEI